MTDFIVRPLSSKWFSATTPVNYLTGLTGTIGSGDNGTITIVDNTATALSIEVVVGATGATALSAAYATNKITVTLGTYLVGTIGSGDDGTITIVDSTASALSIEAVVAESSDQPLSASESGGKITVTLGTDGSGLPDDTKNTATLVAAAISGIGGATWTATASGTGATPISAAITETALTVTAKDALNTATLITAAINDIVSKTWTATASGTGTDSISAAIAEAALSTYVIDGTPCPEAGITLYDGSSTYYVCMIADNTTKNDNWYSFTLTAL